MEPTMPTFQQNYQQQQSRRNIFIIGILAVLVIIFVLFSFLGRPTGFRVTGTDPDLGKFAPMAPYVNVNFSEKLSTEGISLSSDPDIIDSHSVSNKTLRVTFKKDKLEIDKKYTITIKSLHSSTSNDVIKDKKLSFTVKNLDYTALSKELQEAAINTQDKFEYSVNSYRFDGLEDLNDDYGLSAYTTDGLRQGVFNYSRSIKEEFKQVILYKASITTQIVDPNQNIAGVFFTLDIDDKTYSAELDHWSLTKVRLYLRDPQTNAQIYDSGDIDTFENSAANQE